MDYTNEEISWDLTQLRRFYTNYVVKWLNSAMSWTVAQVARARANVGGIVDVSVLNAVGGTAQPYASLAAALADVPATYKRGGVEIQYIDSTTSKYVSFRLMKTSWSTTENDWQGVDDEPTAESDNLVNSGGVYKSYSEIYGGKFLFNVDGAIEYQTGADETGSGYYKRTDYIKIPDVSAISVYNVKGSTSFSAIFFYTKDKVAISGSRYETDVKSYTASVPSNAYYVRFCTYKSDIEGGLSDNTHIVFGNIVDLFQKKVDNKDAEPVFEEVGAESGILDTSSNDSFDVKSPNGYWGSNGIYYESNNYRTTVPIKVGYGDYIIGDSNVFFFITRVDNNGNFIEQYSEPTLRVDFDGYIVISWRFPEGINFKLYQSGTLQGIVDYLGYGWKTPDIELKSPNGYWGTNGTYYEAASYRTSTPIKVNNGDKIRFTARGNVSMLTRVRYDGTYLSTVQQGADSKASYEKTIDFDGYVTFSWRAEDGYIFEILRTKQIAETSLTGVKWGAMGDSFTDEETLSTQTDKRNYVDLIREQTGINAFNYGKSGAGYKRREENNQAFYQIAQTIASNLDVVTIFGSGNDQNYSSVAEVGDARDTGTTTLCGCINTTIDNLLAVNPCIRMGLVTPTPWMSYPPDSTTSTWMSRYSEKIVEIASLRGIPCLDLYHISNLRPWNETVLSELYIDSTHPNTEGHKRIASQIKAFLFEIAG